MTEEELINEIKKTVAVEKKKPASINRDMFDRLGRMRLPDEIDEQNANAREAWRQFRQRHDGPKL